MMIGSGKVFVDIGAVTDGILILPRPIAKQFRKGDEVSGMMVDKVDREAERVILSLDDPELSEPEPVAGGGRPPPRQEAPTKPKAKSKSKAKAKASSMENGTRQ